MDPRLARRVALVAIGLGILGDILFDRQGLGINVPIAVVAALVIATLIRPGTARIDRFDLWLPPVAVLAAAGVALRTDPPLVALDVGLAGAATLAWLLAVSGQPLTRRSVDAVVALGFWASAFMGLGGIVVAARVGADGSLADAGRSGRRVLPVVRGLLLATPVVLVLAALLGSADAAFGSLLDRLFSFPVDLSDLALRSVVVLAMAWIAAGALAIATGDLPLQPDQDLVGPDPRSLGAAARARTGWIQLPGATEALVVLLAVDGLFGLFVAVQLGYLFGGLGAVVSHGMTFSDYAREGYFQLVAVVVLAGGLLIAAEAAGGRSKAFLGSALALVALTFVILASAAVRLALYLQVYGWTELRFYVAASIAWLAIGGALLTVLIARDQIRWLAHGLAFAAIALTLVVTAIGPQAFITDQNIARALDPGLVPAGGRTGLDADYIAGLGDDAIPAMVAALPGLPAADRSQLRWTLVVRRQELDRDSAADGWQAWNLARERAKAELQGIEP